MTRLICLILRATALAMGITVLVLCRLKAVTMGTALTMLAIGLICMAVSSLEHFVDKK